MIDKLINHDFFGPFGMSEKSMDAFGARGAPIATHLPGRKTAAAQRSIKRGTKTWEDVHCDST